MPSLRSGAKSKWVNVWPTPDRMQGVLGVREPAGDSAPHHSLPLQCTCYNTHLLTDPLLQRGSQPLVVTPSSHFNQFLYIPLSEAGQARRFIPAEASHASIMSAGVDVNQAGFTGAPLTAHTRVKGFTNTSSRPSPVGAQHGNQEQQAPAGSHVVMLSHPNMQASLIGPHQSQ